MTTTRHLVIILGDQLDEASSALADFDPTHDKVWMAEVLEESTHVLSSKQRTTVFLSAMRHLLNICAEEMLMSLTQNSTMRTTQAPWQVN